MSSNHWVFWVTSPRLGRSIAEQPGGQQRLFPGALFGPDRHEEQCDRQSSADDEYEHEPAVVVGRKDAEHDQDEPRGGENRTQHVKLASGIGRQRVFDLSREPDDHDDNQRLEDERGRQLIAEVMAPPINGPAAAPMPPIALMTPNARALELTSVNSRWQYVNRRDEQRGADSLQDGVADDECAEIGGDRAEQGSDSVENEPNREAALAPEAIGSICRRGSSGCHDQQKDRNGDLDALHRRVQVRADVVDHHIMFEPAKLQMNCAKAKGGTARTAISGARAGEFCAMSSSVMQIGASDSAFSKSDALSSAHSSRRDTGRPQVANRRAVHQRGRRRSCVADVLGGFGQRQCPASVDPSSCVDGAGRHAVAEISAHSASGCRHPAHRATG